MICNRVNEKIHDYNVPTTVQPPLPTRVLMSLHPICLSASSFIFVYSYKINIQYFIVVEEEVDTKQYILLSWRRIILEMLF